MSWVAGMDLERLEPVLEQLDAHARGMQASISALCAALRNNSSGPAAEPAKRPSVDSLWPATGIGASYWLLLLLAFFAGCCLGVGFRTGRRDFW